jgi:hypothetical protein
MVSMQTRAHAAVEDKDAFVEDFQKIDRHGCVALCLPLYTDRQGNEK